MRTGPQPVGQEAASLVAANSPSAFACHVAVAGVDLEGRTTAPETWMTSPQNLARIAAITYAAEARGGTVEEQADQTRQASQAPAADPGSQQRQHPAQPDQGRGAGGRGR